MGFLLGVGEGEPYICVCVCGKIDKMGYKSKRM